MQGTFQVAGIQRLFHGRRDVGLAVRRFNPVHAFGQGGGPWPQPHHLKAAVLPHGRGRAQQKFLHRQFAARGHQAHAVARAAAAGRGHQLRQGRAYEGAFVLIDFRHDRPQFF